MPDDDEELDPQQKLTIAPPMSNLPTLGAGVNQYARPAIAGPNTTFAANMGALNGQPTPTPQPPAIASPAATTAPAAPVVATSMAPPVIPSPMVAPPPQQSGGARLWQAASSVQNPVARPLAQVGAGIARAGDIALEGLAPRVAALVPGSETETALKNKENEAQFERREQLENSREATAQKPELAEIQGEIKGELGAQAQNARHEDVNTQQSGANQRAAGVQAGANERAANNILSRGSIAQMEADNRAAIAAGKPQPHITILGDDNKAHIMERDPETGQYTVDRGVAPPTYAQVAPSLRTIDVIDPDTGLPTVETIGGKPLGVSATGAYGHEIAQAGAVVRGGDQLIDDLQANKGKLGTLSAWVQKYGLNTPIADPELAGLQAELKTFSALQPAMHGFRSRSAQEAFENIIGDLQKNPDATIASIRGILKTAGAVNPALGNNAKNGSTKTAVPAAVPKVGDIVKGYRFKGGDPSKKESWEKANAGK